VSQIAEPSYLHLALIQMLPAAADPAANVARATRLVRDAVTQHGAELVVLPECTLTGYAMPKESVRTADDLHRLAETVAGPSVEHFAALAKELGIHIVWGLPERRRSTNGHGDKYYNSAVLLSPEGKVLGTYSKVHINKIEIGWGIGWTNGERFYVWPCRTRDVHFNLGIMICYDREVPESARCLAVLGADVIVVPQATSCTCDVPIHREQLRIRAYENEVYVAMANWAGPEFKGHSMIIHPNGTVMKIGGKDEEILSVALDLTELAKLRSDGFYGRHHRRPEAYKPLLE
jgi:predicted amidohydrolase